MSAAPPQPPAAAAGPGHVSVIGEALIDLVAGAEALTFVAHPGGSPFNVAVGLARLGVPTSLMARLGDSPFGTLLRDHAAREGVDVSAAPHAAEATTLAVVALDDQARASYTFYLEGTADWLWTDDELGAMPAATTVVHFASIASWTPPGDARIVARIQRVRAEGAALVSYDPNIRPLLLGDHDRACAAVERNIALAHVVKASADDIEWLYPGASAAEVGERWLALGPSLVVVTDGPDGATGFTPAAGPVVRPGRRVKVADTVGAGDSFSSGLLAALIGRGAASPEGLAACSTAGIEEAIDYAVTASSLTCQRVGADPPTAAEVAAAG